MRGEEHHIQYVPEPPDVGTTFVGWSAFGTLLLLAIAIGGLYGVYRVIAPPSALPAPQTFPQPRVDTSERQELQRIRKAQNEKLNTWKWVDSQHSLVQVPIERAMQLMTKKGAGAYDPLLPSQAGTSSPTAAAERVTIQRGQTSSAAAPEESSSTPEPRK
jgi:hypothetical protein